MFYIGIDVGGTYIKGGIAGADGKIVIKKQQKTDAALGADSVVQKVIELSREMIEESGVGKDNILALGAGIPGLIDSEKGIILYSNNLGWKNVVFSETVSKALNLPVYISNDANVAALGEAAFGAAKGFENSIMITLGTGVGGGVIIDGKIFEGNLGCGAELGHMVIQSGGRQCTCGRKGCFETYGAATALTKDTKNAMLADKNSVLWQIAEHDIENVNAKTAFDAYESDKTAKKVIDDYIFMLSEGIVNLANIFRPQVFLLGGGVSKQGQKLIGLIKPLFDKNIFGTCLGPGVDLKIAALKNDAGFLGAVKLASQKHG